MVIFEEDVEVMVEKATQTLGVQGRMLYGRGVQYDVGVYTLQNDLIWYGDLTKDEMGVKIPELEKIVGMELATAQLG